MLHSSDLTIYTLQLFWTCVCQSIYFICCCCCWVISLYHIYKNYVLNLKYRKTDGLCYSKKTTTRKVILNNILTIIIKFKDQLLVIFCCWLCFFFNIFWFSFLQFFTFLSFVYFSNRVWNVQLLVINYKFLLLFDDLLLITFQYKT